MRGRGTIIQFTQNDIIEFGEMLTPTQRIICDLSLTMSYGEVAAHLNLKMGTVKSNRARGAKSIQWCKDVHTAAKAAAEKMPANK